ncbi:MAG: hypothetical protein JSS02_31635 [Planctomycetes bacterium]|nr:hypothetical protein [Planctomycetota bacterium]
MRHAWIALFICVGISLAGDFFCQSQRSNTNASELISKAAARVALPDNVGTWVLVKADQFDEKVVRVLQCKAHENKQYRDRQTGELIWVSLIAGPSGPLLAHRAEVCYGSMNFQIINEPQPIAIRGAGDQADTFVQLSVQAQNVTADASRIYYSWKPATGRWQAPSNPRLALGGNPMLYKLQVVGPAPDEEAARKSAPDACQRFLAALLPELESALEIQ